MRAKEYLEINKNRIPCYNTVKSCVYDLYKLRRSYQDTQKYFDDRLFADSRYRVMTNNLNGSLNVDDFDLLENEIPISEVVSVRKDIMNAICNDKTFVYAYNILALGKCKYLNLHIVKVAEPWDISYNTPTLVDELCKLYKEDYPKDNLCDYLLEEFNKQFYENNYTKHKKGNDWWLSVFNKSYEIFDLLRINLDDPFEAKKFVTEFTHPDKHFVDAVVQIVTHMIATYEMKTGSENEQQQQERILMEQKLDIVSGLINLHFSDCECLQIDEMELQEKKLEECELENKRLKAEMAEMKERHRQEREQSKGMTNSQIALLTYYIFNALGLNFENSTKVDWAKFINAVSGRSENSMRDKFSFKFDNKQTIKDSEEVIAVMQELFPDIVQTIKNDINKVK